MVFILFSCQNGYKQKLELKQRGLEPKSLSIKQYDKALFEIDTADFQNGLKEIQTDFLPFLGGDMNDSANVTQLFNFVSDTFLIDLYNKTQKKYPDIKVVESEILPVVQRLNHYFPNILLPQIFTYISGVNFEIPIIYGQDAIAIALDCYLDDDDLYQRLGIPRYIRSRFQPNYIAKDLSTTIYDSHFTNQKQTDILHEMVKSGKRLFFVEALNPKMSDEVLLSYTPEQLKWAKENEGNIWAFLIGEQHLYSNDYMMFKKLFADGPFTQDFSDEAPSRLGEFIGLQIVRKFVDKQQNFDLQELMNNNDSQSILQISNYRPAK